MSLAPENVRTLDQLRQRLSHLSKSLGGLTVELERNDPLPTWPTLQRTAQILSHNFNQLLETMESHREFLKAAHAYPLTTFPGHTQEVLLSTLLRKKIEPRIEDWIDDHTNPTKVAARQISQTNGVQNGETGKGTGLSQDDMRGLWEFAVPTSLGIFAKMVDAFDEDFTLAETEDGVENVVTGLKKKLWEDDEEDGEDEKMEDVMATAKPPQEQLDAAEGVDPTKPPMPLESVLRYTSIGSIPRK